MIAGDMTRRILLHGLCLLWLSHATTAHATLTSQQERFQQAREALKHEQLGTFARLYDQLKGYPLRPYLDIWRYWNHLDDPENDARIERILRIYGDIPEATDLRIRWIKALAKRKRWSLVAEQIRMLPKQRHPDSRIQMLSLWHEKKRDSAIRAYTRYWRKVDRPDARLHEIDKAWRKHHHPTAEDLWRRIERKVRQGKWKPAMKLAKQLDKHKREWLRYWQKMQRDPARWLAKPPRAPLPQPWMAHIFDDGLRRLGRSDVLLSHDLFTRHLRPRLAKLHQGRLLRNIALRAAYQHRKEAIDWLRAIPGDYQTDTTRTWPARLLLLNHRWQEALDEIDALPARIRRKEGSRWSYWRARCLQAMGRKEEAMKIFRKLAQERGYYSFLAADRAHLRYTIRERKRKVDPRAMQALQSIPALQRAREWIAFHETGKAYREWVLGMRGKNKRQWHAAMVLAKRWGWSEQALRAASRAGAHDRLDIRFPMAFSREVKRHARHTSLPPSLLWSVIRQESLFNPRAVSPAGARGLMQLMPRTARHLARRIPRLKRHFDLFDPDTNIALGSLYLAERIKQFEHVPLAVASYNAGPKRVRQWIEQTPFDEPEIWIEAIPFRETRTYVQHIMAYRVIYDWRQGLRLSMLSKLVDASV